jgi:osmotically-inducible protein OsmY
MVAGGAAIGVAAAQDRSVGAAVDDTTAYSIIKSQLLAKNLREFSEVDVQVVNGLVLLTGRVASPELRVEAERIAWSAKDVIDVANELNIERAGGFFANLNDEWITKQVQAQHIASARVRAININVETYNGVVYLLGTTRSEDELRAAAEIAANTTGVKQVVSYLEIRPSRAKPNAAGEPALSPVPGPSQPPGGAGDGLAGGPLG